MSYFEIYRYFAGRLTLNNLDILSDILLWIFSIFFLASHREWSGYFSDASGWNTSKCFRTFRGKLSRYIFGCLTLNDFARCRRVNYLVILLGLSRYITLIFFWNPRGELSRNFVRRLVNYLDICRTSHGVVCRHLVGRYKVKYLNALLVDSRWIFLISCWTSRCEWSRYFFRSLILKILYNCRISRGE